MAWYPGATRYELQPESDDQPAIRPTQFIFHSIAAPWTAKRTYEYWRDSTNLESHFGLGYEGDLGQFIGTETRADANYQANRRADGTGAVSIETASNTSGTDPWTAAQVEELIKLGVWLHQKHGIPLRLCRTHDDPGFGYHRLHPEWAVSGTNCPGDARVRQFRELVFPGIVGRAAGPFTPPEQEDDMEPVDVWAYKGKSETRDAYAYLRDTEARAKRIEDRLARLEKQPLTDAQITAIATAVATNPKLADAIADKLAARLAN
ncbi:N-acetylmuramoyl-L-alanine amidase [Streptomyces sp. NBC_01077]|uniref:peptidoglycan recognition protein family protein n=1 Tax=Streptomyces sp. NBC_01077 TaxID=2903746 RepID=UPI00386D0EB9|nr:N-acetylmuramoyl-L-alanine amidase [Streptomyces sp. NBC_01077]